jgi:hypothetical protein
MTLHYTTQTMKIETAPKSAIGYVTEWQQSTDEPRIDRNQSTKPRRSLRKEQSNRPNQKSLSGRPTEVYPGL